MLYLTKILYLITGACKSSIFFISKFNAGAHCSSLKWGVPFICGLPLKNSSKYTGLEKETEFLFTLWLTYTQLNKVNLIRPTNQVFHPSGSQMKNRPKFHYRRHIYLSIRNKCDQCWGGGSKGRRAKNLRKKALKIKVNSQTRTKTHFV